MPDASNYIPQLDLRPPSSMSDRLRTLPPYTSAHTPIHPIRPSIIPSTSPSSYRDSYSNPNIPFSRQSVGSYTRSPVSSAGSSPSDFNPQDIPNSSPVGIPFSSSLGTYSHSNSGSNAPAYENGGPDLHPTTFNCRIRAADGQYIKPEISACIEKGWFKPEDSHWTCYRRNYFTVKCSYDLQPAQYSGPLSICRSNSPGLAEEIKEFAMCISASADNGAKTIELVQHTPKRDKGPQETPKKKTLQPCPAANFHHPTIGLPFSSSRYTSGPDYEQSYQTSSIASFERIQFKSATQNNGRRRAAQQYYQLSVNLFAQILSPHNPEPTWVRVASRESVPVVVRGRSPGHYAEERRGTSSSNGLSSGGGIGGDPTGVGNDSGSLSASSSYGALDESMSAYNAPARLPILDSYTSPTRSSVSQHYASEPARPPPQPSQTHFGGQLGPMMTNYEDMQMQGHSNNQYYPPTMFDSTSRAV